MRIDDLLYKNGKLTNEVTLGFRENGIETEQICSQFEFFSDTR